MTATEPKLALRLSLLLTLYIAQGVPTGVYSHALLPLLRSYHVPLGWLSLVGILAVPWAIKFLWAPLVDKHYFSHLGQRRTWILPMQLAGVLVLLAVALFDPESLRGGGGFVLFFLLMFLINLVAATQDIATDGLAVRLLAFHERGYGNSLQVAGYRLGVIVGGGLLLWAIEGLGWVTSFVGLAVLLVLLTIPVLCLREPAPLTNISMPVASYVDTFSSFFARPGLWGWLVVLLTFKIADSFGSVMVKPMLVDMGYSLKAIGLMVVIVGSIATVIGALLGGWLTVRWGRVRALFVFGTAQIVTIGLYALIPYAPELGFQATPTLVYTLNAAEHLASGLSMAAMLTVIMDCCRVDHAGSDFTLQVSIMSLAGGLFFLLSGWSAEWLGYGPHFLLALGLGLITLWPLWRYPQRMRHFLDPVGGASG